MKPDNQDAATHVAIVLLVALAALPVLVVLSGECTRHVPQPHNVEGRR
jgi:hypothetical protein